MLLRDEWLEREAFDALLEVKVHEWVNALKKYADSGPPNLRAAPAPTIKLN